MIIIILLAAIFKSFSGIIVLLTSFYTSIYLRLRLLDNPPELEHCLMTAIIHQVCGFNPAQ
jgi:hypothetical protein